MKWWSGDKEEFLSRVPKGAILNRYSILQLTNAVFHTFECFLSSWIPIRNPNTDPIQEAIKYGSGTPVCILLHAILQIKVLFDCIRNKIPGKYRYFLFLVALSICALKKRPFAQFK